jgi:hypothetical protein
VTGVLLDLKILLRNNQSRAMIVSNMLRIFIVALLFTPGISFAQYTLVWEDTPASSFAPSSSNVSYQFDMADLEAELSTDITKIDIYIQDLFTFTDLDWTCLDDGAYNVNIPLTDISESYNISGFDFNTYEFDATLFNDLCPGRYRSEELIGVTRVPSKSHTWNDARYIGSSSGDLSFRSYTSPAPTVDNSIQFLPVDTNYSRVASSSCENLSTTTNCTFFYENATTTLNVNANIRWDLFIYTFGLMLFFMGIQTWYTITRKLS